MASKSTNVRTFHWTLRVLRAGFGFAGAVAPGLAGELALRLFCRPRRYPTPERERRWLAEAEREELRAGGERLTTWSWGEGPPVLLMHGWEGRASQMGAFARPLVEAGFRAIAVDAPGHGASEGRSSSLPQFSDAVRRVAGRHGPLHAVVAHSFGAAAVGHRLGAGVEPGRLAFVAAPYDLDDYIRHFAAMVGLPPRGRRAMLSRLERRFRLSWEAVRRSTTAHARDEPLLVVHDRGDSECPVEDARAIARAWPAATLVETEGLGHRRILRDPAVVARVVEFVTRDRQAAAEPRRAVPVAG